MTWALLLLALVCRMITGAYASFFVDEAQSYALVTAAPEHFWVGIRSEPHPPLYYITMAPWAWLSRSELWLRLPSILCSLGALYLNYLTCRRLSGEEKAARIYLALAGVSCSFVVIDAEMRMYGLAELLAAVLLNHAAEITLDPQYTPCKTQNRVVWLTCLTMPLVHYVTAALLGLTLLWTGLVLKDKKRALPMLVGVLLGLGWVLYAVSDTRHSMVTALGYNRGHLVFPWIMLNNFTGIAALDGLSWWRSLHGLTYPLQVVLALAFWVLTWLGARFILGQRRPGHDGARAVLFICLLVTLPILALEVGAYIRGSQWFSYRHLTTLAPGIMFFLATGLARWGLAGDVLVGLVVAVNLLITASLPGDRYWWNQDWRVVAKFIEERAQPGDLALAHHWYSFVGLDYYLWNGACHWEIIRPGQVNVSIPPQLPIQQQIGVNADDLGPALEARLQGHRFFFIINQERTPLVRSWIAQRSEVLDSLTFDTLYSWGHTEVYLLQYRAATPASGPPNSGAAP